MGFAPVYEELTLEKAKERVDDLVLEGFSRESILIYKEDEKLRIGVD